MKIPIWVDGLSSLEERDIAYAERNLLALHYAQGWYRDTDNNWEGFQRVLSLDHGRLTFHIPDGFDVGNLPEIDQASGWNGHTTEGKWTRVMNERGITPCK